jgi:hypothetical protein
LQGNTSEPKHKAKLTAIKNFITVVMPFVDAFPNALLNVEMVELLSACLLINPLQDSHDAIHHRIHAVVVYLPTLLHEDLFKLNR